MRSFEQRMAEISRRSQEIFTQRKRRRKRLLTLCIPLVLCIGLLTWMLLPGGAKDGGLFVSMDSLSQESAMSNGTAGGAPMGGLGGKRIEINDGVIADLWLDPTRTEPLANLLEELTVLPPTSSSSMHSNSDSQEVAPETSGQDDEKTAGEGIRITVFHPDGSSTVYRLQGSTLWYAAQPIDLTPEQLQRLLDALG